LLLRERLRKKVKENMSELINEYLSDPDTAKMSFDYLLFVSLTNIPVKIPEGVLHRKALNVASGEK
jgi:hypothetical protein